MSIARARAPVSALKLDLDHVVDGEALAVVELSRGATPPVDFDGEFEPIEREHRFVEPRALPLIAPPIVEHDLAARVAHEHVDAAERFAVQRDEPDRPLNY